MEFILPRGMRDLGPEEYNLLEKIRSSFIEVAELFDFKIMEPSPIELLKTLEAKSGSGIREEIYHFQDKSGRDVGLRFDLTVGLTRYAASDRGLPFPIKLGAFSGMWRYDEPQYGRYRWFYQWDVEIFGSSDLEADAEVIDFSSTLFKSLGLKDISIEIGDRKIVEEYIRRSINISEESKVSDLLRAVDKIRKRSESELIKEYTGKGFSREALEDLFGFIKRKGSAKEVLSSIESQESSKLNELFDSLSSRGIERVSLNVGIVRGLDYYTGIVFEVFDKLKPELGALAGGGRYDTLPAIFDRPEMPATGAAGGVERTILALSKGNTPRETRGLVFVAYVSKDMRNVASGVGKRLRESGYRVDLELSGRSLRKQLENASSQKAKYVILVAPREYAERKVIVRDMEKGDEKTVEINSLQKVLE